jgi:V8-like Glu-specific endopeptidase
MNRCTVALAVALGITGCATDLRREDASVNASNRIHMQSKPAVVRVWSGCVGEVVSGRSAWRGAHLGHGSGFFVHSDGYVLTNAHVVARTKSGDRACQDGLVRTFTMIKMRRAGLPANQESFDKVRAEMQKDGIEIRGYHRINDVVTQSGERHKYEIKAYGAPVGDGKDLEFGKDVAVLKIEIKNAPTLPLGESHKTKVGDRVWIIGYPGAAESDEAFDEKSALEPTTNDGAISSQKRSTDGSPILGTNANTSGGNSGGPAIDERGRVIGQLTFHLSPNGEKVQGFNFLVPIDTAKEFVRQAGISETRGPVDEHWLAGLDHYWSHEYKDAEKRFQTALDLFPDHSEAKRLIQECKEQILAGNDKSRSIRPLALAAGVLVLASLALAVAEIRRRRRAPQPQATSAYPAAPVFGQAYALAPAGANYLAAPLPALAGVATSYPQLPAAGYATPSDVAQNSPRLYHKTVAYQAPAHATLTRLRCVEGRFAGCEMLVGNGVIIGRDPQRAQLVVDDAQISGQHAWVGLLDGKLVVRDLGSTNGTYLARDMASRVGEIDLEDGDVLVIGQQQSLKLQVVCA